MIRRSTWIVLAVFIVLLIGAILLTRSGKQLISEPTPTAAPTEATLLDPSKDLISGIKVESIVGPSFSATLGIDNSWGVQEPPGSAITAGQITEATTSLGTMKVIGSFAEPLALDAVGMVSPTTRITLTMKDGRIRIIAVGNTTPTGTGYYVMLDNLPVVVVSKPALEPILNLVVAPTPTPEPALEGTLTPETSTPSTP